MVRRVAVLLAVISALVAVNSNGRIAAAQACEVMVSGRCCKLSNGAVYCGDIEPPDEPPLVGDDTDGDGEADGEGPSLTRFVWRHVLLATHQDPVGRGWNCVPRTAGDPPGLYYIYQWVLVDLLHGGQVQSEPEQCHWNPPRPGDDPAPSPIPNPPSTGEVVEASKSLLVADPQWNPRVRGLTGLETWLWCADPGEVVVNVTIRGWEVEAHAGVTDVNWSISGPETLSLDGSGGCGSEAQPSARWTPQVMGTASIQTIGTWGGYWTLSRWDSVLGTYQLGTVEVSGAPQPYEITEHVGVLVD